MRGVRDKICKIQVRELRPRSVSFMFLAAVRVMPEMHEKEAMIYPNPQGLKPKLKIILYSDFYSGAGR